MKLFLSLFGAHGGIGGYLTVFSPLKTVRASFPAHGFQVDHASTIYPWFGVSPSSPFAHMGIWHLTFNDVRPVSSFSLRVRKSIKSRIHKVNSVDHDLGRND